ncbi:constitutive coactivator of peroxisome proliferator-activated receptor gamma isoform X2 [Varanus komodoensis]|uniref:constitutive coactivator of peroxisome proliferator-activated receptor gamma isoform X2 n=1 Tax=Varanus komodoensis TaxID=61221 RepID=UPI001CF7A058|nr:constitutive coactivator of peroxisome proliferator-activated receptor gamma isoform X2 [Varanus komodoensis]
MGVRGLHWFVTSTCPGGCMVVNLKEMAENHQSKYPGSVPVLVVDAMSCLRQWYTPESWVCGGQWCEYLSNLDGFIRAFSAAGIKLVFYFDGLVEQKKRDEWVKRRLKNNKEIARIFQFLKINKQQPGRGMFFIPSGLATFTCFALKTLGQETRCSLQEADHEVASYGLHNNCLGILGEDTDYLIYDTVPYFSINKLCLEKLETITYSRQNLCSMLGLCLTDLPLLACILGTDIIPERAMESFRNKCIASSSGKSQCSDKRSSMILAVANYISTIPRSYDSVITLAEMLPQGLDKTILYQGIESYLLPGQQSPWLPCDFSHHSVASTQQEVPLCSDQEIFQIAKQQHVRAENYMVYNILSSGEVECSNTLEDEQDAELPGQARIYQLARQHIYSILLESVKDVHGTYPVVKEWFVYPGNSLQQPDLIQPKQLPGGTPSLRLLWLGRGPEDEKRRYCTFLACFQLQDVAEELQALEAPTGAVCTLLLYLILQVGSLSLEDLNAFMAQALCLKGKSAAQLADLQLAQVDSRAVQLGSLFIRGLCVLVMANSACGFPFRMDDLMPWHIFDGKLFQEKYEQAHRGCHLHELLEGNTDKEDAKVLVFRIQEEFSHITSTGNTLGESLSHLVIQLNSSLQVRDLGQDMDHQGDKDSSLLLSESLLQNMAQLILLIINRTTKQIVLIVCKN